MLTVREALASQRNGDQWKVPGTPRYHSIVVVGEGLKLHPPLCREALAFWAADDKLPVWQ